jgi:hypothetical protein
MNQHDRVEHAIAEHDEQVQKARNVTAALGEIERTIGLLAWHIERTFTDAEARYELAGQLDNLRRAIRKVEEDQ